MPNKFYRATIELTTTTTHDLVIEARGPQEADRIAKTAASLIEKMQNVPPHIQARLTRLVWIPVPAPPKKP